MEPIAKVWIFKSKSNPKADPYQTLLYTDGTTSCNCPGWCRRMTADGNRSCRHTRDVDTNMADRTADSFTDYRTGYRLAPEVNPQPAKSKPMKTPSAKTPPVQGVRRRFDWTE